MRPFDPWPTATGYLHDVRTAQLRAAVGRLPLRLRVGPTVREQQRRLIDMAEDFVRHDIAAWEACGGNGGERP